jgi:hypothetical protein
MLVPLPAAQASIVMDFLLLDRFLVPMLLSPVQQYQVLVLWLLKL